MKEMRDDIEDWMRREETTVKSVMDAVDFCTSYLDSLSDATGQISVEASVIMDRMMKDRKESLITYKSKNHFTSRFADRIPNSE